MQRPEVSPLLNLPMASLSLSTTLLGHKARVWHVSWHPTLPVLASCGEDKTLRVWSPVPCTPTTTPTSTTSSSPSSSSGPLSERWHSVAELDGFSTRTVRCCEWSPCGRFLAATSFDGNTTVWKVGGQALAAGALSGVTAAGGVSPADLTFDVIVELDGHESEVKGVSWSPSGEILATSGRDKSVWLWEAVEEGSDFECIAVLHGHEQDVKAVVWHPTRELLVSCSYDDSIKMWGEAVDDWVAVQTLAKAHASTVWGCAWNPQGSHLASVGNDGSLKLWGTAPAPPPSSGSTAVEDALTLTPLGGLEEAHGVRAAFSVHWSGEGVGVGGEGGGAESGAAGASGALLSSILATSGADDCVRLYSVGGAGGEKGAAGTSITTLTTLHKAHEGDVNVVRWHRTLPVLATGGDDGAIKLWLYKQQG